MNKRLQVLYMVVAVLFSLVPTSAVLARGTGSGNGSGGGGQTTATQGSEATKSPEVEVEHPPEVEVKPKEVETRKSNLIEQNKERAKELIKTEKPETKKTPEERQKRCAEKKKGLETKIVRLNTNAKKHYDRISDFLDKLVAYKIANNIENADLDAAIMAATEAKTTAAASVEALSSLQTTVNCESGTVATDVATFKAAAEKARADLLTYRKAVATAHTTLEGLKETTTGDKQ
ncbi:MAG: hypothetical protein NTX11_03485 [Candidatus Saccharibacteria bacterium]|nr:hypothetical protein [Candidatus Saccharibacteria bacterium]